jgi:hypothetical protein
MSPEYCFNCGEEVYNLGELPTLYLEGQLFFFCDDWCKEETLREERGGD